MTTDNKESGYEIYEQKSGRKVGTISPEGQVCCFEKRDQQRLEKFLRRDILVREGEGEEEEAESLLEETMCFFGVATLRPGDPEYLPTALRQLPLLTDYKVSEHR
jgi:hypothetical protein